MTTTVPTEAHAHSTAPFIITVDELSTPKGNLRTRKAIDARRRVVVRVDGVPAFVSGSALGRSAAPGTSRIVDGGVTEIAVTVVLVAGVVAVVGLSVVAVVCLYGMEKGYSVTARHRTGSTGSVFDDEIEFVLVPPTGA